MRFCATDKLLELGDMEVEIIEERYIDILGRGVDAGQKALQILPDTVKFKIVEREGQRGVIEVGGALSRSRRKEMDVEHL